jgi:hypothetical protein
VALERLIPEELWRKLFARGPILGLVAFAAIAATIAYCETRAAEVVVKAVVTGCVDGVDVAVKRSERLFGAVIASHGPPAREEDGGNSLFFENPTSDGRALPSFWLRLYDDGDPCYWAISVSARIAPPSPNADGLAEALNGYALRGKWESPGRWFANDEGLWIWRRFDLRKIHADAWWVEDLLDLGAFWSSEWLAEAREVVAGRAEAPREMRWRPGRDPKTVLENAQRFLAEAGVRSDAR